MALLGTLGVKLTAFTAKFESDMKQATASIKKAQGAMTAVSIASAAMFAGGVIATGKLIEAASDVAEQMNVLDIAFGDNRKGVEAWAKTTSKAMGRSVTDLKDYAGQIGALLAPTQGVSKSTADMATSLAGLAVDLGSVFNAAENETLTALKAALIGSSEPMRRFGVNMTVAALEAFALEKGMKASFKQMSAAEQQTLRYNFILEKTAAFQGDAEKTAAGWANMTKRVGGQVTDLTAELGAALLPTAEKVIADVSDMLVWFQGLSKEWKEGAAWAVVIGTGVAGITAVLVPLVAIIPSVVAGFGALAGAAGGVATAMGAIAWPTALIIAALAAVVVAIVLFRKAWKENLGGIRTLVLFTVNEIGDWWTQMINGLAFEWKELKRGVLQSLDVMRSGLASFFRFMKPEWAKALDEVDLFKDEIEGTGATWKKIEADSGKALGGIKDDLGDMADFVGEAFQEAGADIKTMFTQMASDMGLLSDAAETAAIDVKAATAPGPGGIGPGGGGAGINVQGDLLGEFQAKVKSVFSSAGDGVSEGMVAAVGIFANAISESAPRIAGLMQGAMQGFAAGGPIGALIGAAASFLTSIEGFQEFLAIGERALTPVANLLENFFDAFLPLIDALGSLGDSFQNMLTAIVSPIFEVLGAALGPFVEVIGWIAEQLQKAVDWISTAFQDVMFEIGKVFRGWLDAVADKLQGPKFAREFNEKTEKAVQTMNDAVGNHGEIIGDIEPEIEDLGEAASEASESFREASAALTNVPQGFKIAAARFAAIGSGGAFSGLGAGVAGSLGVSSGKTFNVENVFVTSDDPEDFLNKLQDAAAWNSFANTGTPLQTPPDPNKR